MRVFSKLILSFVLSLAIYFYVTSGNGGKKLITKNDPVDLLLLSDSSKVVHRKIKTDEINKGTKVILVMNPTVCAYCVSQKGDIEELCEYLSSHGIDMYGVALESNKYEMKGYLRTLDIRIPFLVLRESNLIKKSKIKKEKVPYIALHESGDLLYRSNISLSMSKNRGIISNIKEIVHERYVRGE